MDREWPEGVGWTNRSRASMNSGDRRTSIEPKRRSVAVEQVELVCAEASPSAGRQTNRRRKRVKGKHGAPILIRKAEADGLLCAHPITGLREPFAANLQIYRVLSFSRFVKNPMHRTYIASYGTHTHQEQRVFDSQVEPYLDLR